MHTGVFKSAWHWPLSAPIPVKGKPSLISMGAELKHFTLCFWKSHTQGGRLLALASEITEFFPAALASLPVLPCDWLQDSAIWDIMFVCHVTTELWDFLKFLTLNSSNICSQINSNRKLESGNSTRKCCIAFSPWEQRRMSCIYMSANEQRHIFFMRKLSSMLSNGHLKWNK